MKKSLLLFVFFLCCIAHYTHAQIITTIAGNDTAGVNDGGPATDAGLAHPNGVAIDGAGNIYIADEGNNRIRKINTTGIITTIAGTGTHGFSGDNGPATLAKLDNPRGIAIDNAGNIYIADNYNFRIRRVSTSGVITTVAGNGTNGFSGDGVLATATEISQINAIATDSLGNLYIPDAGNNRIRKISPSGIITTIAGDGLQGYSGDGEAASVAELYNPDAIAIDKYNNLYIGDHGNFRIRKISSSGIITTIAGTGIAGFSGDGGLATAAECGGLYGIAADAEGNVYFADNYSIREINSYGIINTIAGDDIPGYSGDGGNPVLAELNTPSGLAVDGLENVYIADWANDRIRYVYDRPVKVQNVNTIIPGIEVFPNPFATQFTITVVAATDEDVTLTITDIVGKTIKQLTATTNQPMNIQIDAPDGIYIINAVTTKARWTKKIELLA